jgi:methylthioxylose transferase
MRRLRGPESGPRGTSSGVADSDPAPPADPPADAGDPGAHRGNTGGAGASDPGTGRGNTGGGGAAGAAAGRGERRVERLDLTVWTVLVGLGLGLTLLAVGLGARLDTAAAPFAGRYALHVDLASLLAPTVAVLVLLAVANGLVDRLRWPAVLLAGYVVAAAWALALAAVDGGSGLTHGLAGPDGYLADVPRVGDDPGAFLAGFAAHAADYTPATRDHPPLPVLLLWAAGRLGLHRPVLLGIAVTLVGALVAPLVAVAVRVLCGEVAARRLVPVLALAPYAVWVAVSMDAVTAALGAGFVAAAAVGSRSGRPGPTRLLWASLCGVLLGTAALFSYAVVWLAATVPCLYFVRRRPLLNVATGVCALLPLVAVQAAGFSWSEGLASSRRDLAGSAGAQGSALVWGLLGLVVLLLAGGPALVATMRKVRLTPGWPFLVGAALAVAWALLAGLTRGGAERDWLPFFPWLLVGAVAPERRCDPPPRTPLLLTAAAAATAVCLQAVLRSPW